jgi:hypothetical protein
MIIHIRTIVRMAAGRPYWSRASDWPLSESRARRTLLFAGSNGPTALTFTTTASPRAEPSA